MTIRPGTYRPTRKGFTARVVTSVTDTSVTFTPANQPNVSHTMLVGDFATWAEIARVVFE